MQNTTQNILIANTSKEVTLSAKNAIQSSSTKKYRPHKRLSEEQKNMIGKFFMEKMELRKIARVIGVSLFTIQYHIKKA